jgi:asparagine synthase (glutamine-hydrolysing)
MCGLTAVVGARRPAERHLNASLDLLTHRGPDARGTWSDEDVWLGSRRLAILDLSPAGTMPMTVGGRFVGVYNGEIYNYRELREELEGLGHHFATGTDTEVLLSAFAEWGAACVTRFNGMWAFAVWDAVERRLFVSRDRFGVKPLYYAQGSGRLTLASEPKAILHLHPELRVVDDRTLHTLLVEKRLDIIDHSFYRGISVVPPGHSATFAPGDTALKLERYWRLSPDGDGSERTDQEIADEFGALFEDAVRLRFRSDVAVGVTLSGGLDSTAVLHASHRRGDGGGQLTAYTSTYAGGGEIDERQWARRAASAYPEVRLEEVDARVDDWLATLRRICWHMDGPGFSPAVFPLWRIMERARATNVPVLLEGQGADEMLGGYPRHTALAVLEYASELAVRPSGDRLRPLASAARAAQRSHGTRRLVLDTSLAAIPSLAALQRRRAGVEDALRSDWRARVAKDAGPARRPMRWRGGLEAGLLGDFEAALLPGFLQYGDAISMAHSVESRLPFLDYRVVECAFGLPSRSKIGEGYTKRVLRDYLRAGGQGAIAERRDKRGYPTPVHGWLAADRGRRLREILLAPQARIREYASREGLERLIARHSTGRLSGADQVYALVATELWLQECL